MVPGNACYYSIGHEEVSMTDNQIINALLVQPVIQKIDLTTAQKQDAIRAWISVAINEIATAYDWDFVTDSASTTTVDGTATYTLKGNNNNCQDIINIVYDNNMLEEYESLAMDEFLTGRSISGVQIWVHENRASGGFPIVRLHASPSEAKTLTYRYLKKNIGIGDIPDQYSYVVLSAVGKHIIPDFVYQYERDLRRMIDSYKRGGNSPQYVRRDPEAVARNNERAGLYGYGQKYYSSND